MKKIMIVGKKSIKGMLLFALIVLAIMSGVGAWMSGVLPLQIAGIFVTVLVIAGCVGQYIIWSKEG